jgi:hypothetical protein
MRMTDGDCPVLLGKEPTRRLARAPKGRGRTRTFLGGLLALSVCAGAAACTGDVGDPETEEPSGPGGPSGTSGDPPIEELIEPSPAGIRRLTAPQYVNSMRVLLGEAAGAEAASLVAVADPPFDAPLDAFDAIGAAHLSLSPAAVEQLESFARAIAAVVKNEPGKLQSLVPCAPSGPADAACHRQFVERFGRNAFRRPLTEDELVAYTGVAQAAATHAEIQSFDEGTYYALSALLQAPDFLYIVELGDEAAEDPARRRLTGLELGTRMSFFILQQTPDAATLDRIEAEGLDTPEKARALAEEMVARPEARPALANHFAEVYRLRELRTDVVKDPAKFPQWNQELAASMEEEMLRLVEDVVWTRNGDARDIFDADYTFVNEALAAIYAVPPPDSAWEKVQLPVAQGRAGFLGSAAFAARLSSGTRNSPTRRGLFVQTTLLCGDIPPPPVGVDTQIPEDDPNKPMTLKEKLAAHQKDPTCANCHKHMDPIGFAFEKIDPVGAFRTTDNGVAIDSSASVDGLGEFDSPAALGAILRELPRAQRCTIQQLYRQSMGHLEKSGEAPAIDQIEESYATSGYSLQTLIVDIAASPAFSLVGEPK